MLFKYNIYTYIITNAGVNLHPAQLSGGVIIITVGTYVDPQLIAHCGIWTQSTVLVGVVFHVPIIYDYNIKAVMIAPPCRCLGGS